MQVRRALLGLALCTLGCETTPPDVTREQAVRTKLGVPRDAARVIVFSQSAHLDIDWQNTFDGYYDTFVGDIFTKAADVLEAQDRATYSVAEMAFLKHHVEAHPNELPRLRAAAARGALHVVGGGMTSPDTVLPETELLLHDFMYGARFAEDTLGTRAHAAWLPDSFGHAATVPDLLASLGFTSVAFARVDGASTLFENIQHGEQVRPGSTAAQLEALGSADFLWRGPGGGTVLAHYLSHNFYCTGDDIDYDEPLQIPGGHVGVYEGDQPDFTDGKIDGYIAALAPYAKTPYLFVPVGCDFQFPKEKLIAYLDGYNKRRYGSTGVYAVTGAFDDYAELVLAHKDALPTMEADMTPYFEGFYGSRADVKGAVRRATRPFLEAELFASALGDGARTALGTATDDLELLTRADHHDFVTGTATDAVVATEQLPLLATAQAAGDAALASVASAIASHIAPFPESRARVLALNAAATTRSGVVTAHLTFAAPLADAGLHAHVGNADLPVEVLGTDGAAGAITAADVRVQLDSLLPFSWQIVDFVPGAVAAPASPLSVSLLDELGQATTGSAVSRVVLSNAHVVAEWRRTVGFALTSLAIDGKETIAAPSFVVHDAADRGGLWRIGSEMSGCTYTPLPPATDASAETVELLAHSASLVGVSFKTAGGTKEAWLSAQDTGLDLAITTSATKAQTRTASFAFAVGADAPLRTSLAGGYADRQPMKLYDPTFWPAVEWAQSGDIVVLLRQSTGVRFSSAGEVELMVVRDAEQEGCDLLGGVGSDLGTHRIEWRVERANTAADAARTAQAFNRPVIAIPVAGGTASDLPPGRSLFQVYGAGILSTAKPADRGEGVIVRVLLTPGPVTLVAPDLIGRTLTRTDAAERDLAALGTVPAELVLDRDYDGAIVTLRIR